MIQKQTPSLYPSFMLYDVKANDLNLSQKQIEDFINQFPQHYRQIFNLYYVQGYTQQYVAENLSLTKQTVNTNIKNIKKRMKTLSQFWNNHITLIVGRSGTGKTTLEKILCDAYNAKAIKSYTTRPKRDDSEDNHIFISPSEVENYPNKIATTTINNNFYFATKKQLDKSQIYVIDPNGLYKLTTNFPDLTFNIIYLKLDKVQHNAYLNKRRSESNETKKLQEQRLASENQQFNNFENKLATNQLPPNINILNIKDLLPNYRQK